ncbi:lipid II flippase MurJ [Streptomyces sulphureus]|uniref:lipid II flippase MurJ n=1 Tax=Streptomyces sulphureus TaxID=47758 RepID=UPI0003824DDF|nr:lipid II flippase MurJ [Streptomyces sulphureus]
MTDMHAAPAEPGPKPTGGAGAGADGPRGTGRFLARAAAVTAALTAAGSLCGLLRDQVIAQLFGADADTDAFLVAWTVPELASTLLIEDAMALVLVPAFSVALSLRETGHRGGTVHTPGPDPVRELVRTTLPRLSLWLAGAGVALALAAPFLVRAMAPGLTDPGTAVDCMRLVSLNVVTFGAAGYCSALLRAHRSFVAPAAIYVTYNAAIIASMLAGHSAWGVRSAAVGVAVGGALMVAVQLPAFFRRLPAVRRDCAAGNRRRRGAANLTLLTFGMLAPVTIFALSRQAQVFYERFLASSLPAGAISHLNYAQKVAQMPMVLSLMVCTVTFPVVARAMADGEPERARRRVERDLGLVGVVVLLGTAYVVACAPQIVQLLFERGEFGPRDTADTASVMRVYSCGLLGHSLVGALARPFFSGIRPGWYPAVAMGAGLAVTGAVGAATVGPWGVHGIAAANAAGITTTALLLMRGLGAHVIAIDVRAVTKGLLRLLLAAAAAAAAGWAAARVPDAPLPATVVGGVTVLLVFASVALLVRASEVAQLLTALGRRLVHVR